MANLAAIYRDQGKCDDAQKLQEKVLELSERQLGLEHPDTLRVMEDLGCTYRCIGEISLSIKLLEIAAANQTGY
jgi:hypothetical protein